MDWNVHVHAHKRSRKDKNIYACWLPDWINKYGIPLQCVDPLGFLTLNYLCNAVSREIRGDTALHKQRLYFTAFEQRIDVYITKRHILSVLTYLNIIILEWRLTE